MSDDDFLSRWSRRKRSAEPDETLPRDDAELVAAEAPGAETDEEVLARLGLRHPDDMQPGDDFAAFLRASVPRHLKSVAYRKLWRSNPTLACVDGLNDYDGDFTGTGVPAGGLKTSYQVGKGILSRIADLTENHPEEGEPALAGAEDEDEPIESDVASAIESSKNVQYPESVHGEDTVRTARRRMVFRTKG